MYFGDEYAVGITFIYDEPGEKVEQIEVESNGAAKEEILEKKVIETLPQTEDEIERQKQDEKRQDEEAIGEKDA